MDTKAVWSLPKPIPNLCLPYCREIKNQSKDLIAAKMEKPFLDLVGAFSSILRGRYRDLDLAAEFIEFALQINPKSTRALHWKALLTMKQVKFHNVTVFIIAATNL